MNKDAIELYQPINVLKSVAEDIWLVDGSVVEMSMYGQRYTAVLRRCLRCPKGYRSA